MHLLVLSAFRQDTGQGLRQVLYGLNAPFGAQCFPTEKDVLAAFGATVSMHLLVLSAFRRGTPRKRATSFLVSMHLLVLSAFRLKRRRSYSRRVLPVSMHLLVLSAFRPGYAVVRVEAAASLNAPFGAQCFPTRLARGFRRRGQGLNAPFGAQCFPTGDDTPIVLFVSRSQCTFWCSVLSDKGARQRYRHCRVRLNAPFGAQCFPT